MAHEDLMLRHFCFLALNIATSGDYVSVCLGVWPLASAEEGGC